MSNLNKYFFGIFAVFTFSFTAIAQEVEEVVVTATKKSESIQDLALSIEAFTAEDVSENMIQDSDDLAEVVPGLITAKVLVLVQVMQLEELVLMVLVLLLLVQLLLLKMATTTTVLLLLI